MSASEPTPFRIPSRSSPPARGVGKPLARLEHGPRIARLEQPAGAGAQPLGRAHAQLLLEGGDGAAPGCGCGVDELGVTGDAVYAREGTVH